VTLTNNCHLIAAKLPNARWAEYASAAIGHPAGTHRTRRVRPRQPLPSEAHLMSEYGVSRGSVRHALQVLAEEGLTITIQGRGTYVLPID
jgi:DNA-binding transcriptional MocR family regulator